MNRTNTPWLNGDTNDLNFDLSSEHESCTLSRQENFYNDYLMNPDNSIIKIDIPYFDLINLPNTSYMVYAVEVITDIFEFTVKRRYKQFLILNSKVKGEYTFPSKDWTSSFTTIFGNFSSMEKTADKRRLPLKSYLNSILENYRKEPQKFSGDFVEMLKFLSFKQFMQDRIKNKVSKTFTPHTMRKKTKILKKNEENLILSMNELEESLIHEMKKLNLILDKNQYTQGRDMLIKIVQKIQEIVLELKKRINSNHVKMVLLGNTSFANKNMPIQVFGEGKSNKQVGIIQFALSISENPLVSIAILKIIVCSFLQPSINYSCSLFEKILFLANFKIFTPSEINLQYILNEEMIEFREYYFKLLDFYLLTKIERHLGEGKKVESKIQKKYPDFNIERQITEGIIEKYMDPRVKQMFIPWIQRNSQIPELRTHRKIEGSSFLSTQLKDIEQILPSNTIQSKHALHDTCINSSDPSKQPFKKTQSVQFQMKICDQCKNQKTMSTREEFFIQNKQSLITKVHEDKLFCIKMQSNEKEDHSFIKFTIEADENDSFPIFSTFTHSLVQEKKWNSLLKQHKIDGITNTIKQIYQFPGRKFKAFRFYETMQSTVSNEWQEEKSQIHNWIIDDEEKNEATTIPESEVIQNPADKTNFNSVKLQEKELYLNCQKIVIKKQALNKLKENTFNQLISVEKGLKKMKNRKKKHITVVKIEYVFEHPSVQRFFRSQVNGSTHIMWDDLITFCSQDCV